MKLATQSSPRSKSANQPVILTTAPQQKDATKDCLRDKLHTGCFACDPSHLFGLKLRCQLIDDGKRAQAAFTPSAWMRSYAEQIHGGLISTLLDSAMTQFLLLHGIQAVTGTLDLRYRKPAPIDHNFTVTAWCHENRGRILRMRAEFRDSDGTLITEARAQFAKVTR